jgi:DNA modification methylase
LTFKIELIKGVYKAMNILNKIENKDCLEYLKTLENESVDCCITDEPYGILTGHKIEEGYNLNIALQVRKEIYRVLKKDAWFIFFSQFPNAWDFGRITFEAGFKPWGECNEIVWCKRQNSSAFNKVARIHENIFVFQKGKPETYENKVPTEDIVVDNAFHGIASFASVKRLFAELFKFYNTGVKTKITASNHSQICYDDYSKYSAMQKLDASQFTWCSHLRRIPSVWSFYLDGKRHRLSHKARLNEKTKDIKTGSAHITQKPILLLRRLVKLFTKQGDVILDCFGGSGTTFLAAKQEGRNFLGCERDEKYCKIINERLENWETDLERQDKWLKDRGVNDFNSDIQPTIQSKASLFKNE